MFFVVIIAHLVAVLFAFCGLVQLGSFLSEPNPSNAAVFGAGAFAAGLAKAAWPIAVAIVVEIFIQIACMLEKLLIARSSGDDVTATAPKAKVKPIVKKQSEQPSESGMFFRANRAPEPPAAPHVEEPITEEKKTEQVKAESVVPEKKEPSLSFFKVD